MWEDFCFLLCYCVLVKKNNNNNRYSDIGRVLLVVFIGDEKFEKM